ncbi:transcription-repair coupling factor [Endozoicomonas montiporae]|uniref:Transcription-repair-coupling factor n=2 Tax=Endozoicomonas montiporae TaxID=1027273 RepID=A0A081N6U2_9GAMM|nr:transcription-repair coupling factor [Endozoicomonas montiporae]AMO56506.1 transcription-repair coupling factor [Endozoicomonas montiporae CL-33]KEQ14165.1 transcription-repair coupling factor [Endozoicomonas montiporae]
MSQASLPLPTHAGDKIIWANLDQTASAYAIASAARDSSKPLLVITPDSNRANSLEEELNFFLNGNNQVEIMHFPDWEILPYDAFSPHQDIVSQRLETLYRLPRCHHSILIISITTLLHRMSPRSYLESNCLMISRGDQFLLEQRRQQLEQAGYRCVDTVYEHGEFAIRGALMDIFPMGADQPFRIDLFDDEIDTLRAFDPETQRSTEQVDSIELLPGHEFPMDKASRDQFRSRFRDTFDVDHRECPMYQDIGQGMASPGIEYYLPLFFEETATLLDHLPEKTIVVQCQGVQDALQHFWKDVNDRYENRKVDPLRPLLPPHRVMMPPEELNAKLLDYGKARLETAEVQAKQGRYNLSRLPLPELTLNARADNPLAPLETFIASGPRILVVAESAGRREVLLEMLAQNQIKPVEFANWSTFLGHSESLGITLGSLEAGLHLAEHNIALIPEALLLGQRVMQKRRRRGDSEYQSDQVIRNLTELREGAPVVHIDHGVGRYRGLQTLSIDAQEAEFLTLEYASEAKLYVPVASLHLVARYTGTDDELAPLHRLGSEQWSKARRKAAEKARDAAAELLDIYARREALQGFAFDSPDQHYHAFSAGFPFEETPDQQQAIESVINDMTASQPMDRLVCGDVGFGKTEVAMRAAFIAVQSGKQVAILVPTTLLAQQHYESFRDRFADWPMEIDVVSRFRSAKQVQGLKEKLQEGKIDIIIGTHKILQGDLQFKNLGLLIIDEEHRFGVRHKEKLKSLRSEVDILTLTATPIPRTLNMAMSGIRDLSIIATPPAKRLSVKTFVRQHDDQLIKEAVLRELLRGGQVYYLHNEVSSIEKAAEDLQSLIPEARIGIGHGQMRERELEQVMSDFYHKRYNILVCTTIIETGIDVPSANTIVIHRADKFGLAQLHQLRGRVGRSHHQAYAYLMTPSPKSMTKDATKRLDAISEAQDLGAGFMLASNDLEIRGAGELLGEDQSGQIQSVGFTLYTEMLEKAVNAIRRGETPNLDKPLQQGTEVNLRLPALLPEDYIHDVHNRLILYKRIAAANSNNDLKALQVELIDRFGLLPEQAKNLFRQTRLRLTAEKLGIIKLDAGEGSIRIEFEEQPKIDPLAIIQMIQADPHLYKLEGSSVFKYSAPNSGAMEQPEQRFAGVESLLQRLAG